MHKQFKLILFILLLAGISNPVTAATTIYTREQCVEMALARNPQVLASIERKAQAEWQKKAVHDDFLPSLKMDYSYTYLDDKESFDPGIPGTDKISITKHDNYMMSLYIDQPLFTGFRLTETYNLADLGLKVAISGEQLAKLDIIFRTTRAYYNYLMYQKLEQVANVALAQLASHLHDSEQFFKNEVIPQNDLLQSQVHFANARQEALLAASRTRVARMALATIIKEPLNLEFEVEDSPNLEDLPGDVDSFIQQALVDRPELQRANYNLEATKKQITLAKSSYYPEIFLRAAHNRYAGNPLVDGHGLSDIQDSRECMIGVYASWELFAWGQTKHEVNRATAASRESNHALAGVIDEVQLEVQSNFIGAETAYENIATAKLAVDQAEENLRMVSLRYKNQIATNTNVLDANTLLSDTQTNYYQAVYDYNIRLAGLARSVGVTSWEQLGEN
jgi:outer membrane protein TolC